MKSKVALILCFVMILSCLASCKKATEESEISQDFPENADIDNDELLPLEIAENALYFTGTYTPRSWDGSDIGYFTDMLNERYSYGRCDLGITGYLESHKDTLDRANTYFYVGITLHDSTISDKEELDSKKKRMLNQVGFIYKDEPYMKEDYVNNLSSSYKDLSFDEYKENYDERIAPVFLKHAQNLMPEVDISGYNYYELLTDFCFYKTGYITADGLTELVENFTEVTVTWLPAPDDRARFLTYIAPYKIEE